MRIFLSRKFILFSIVGGSLLIFDNVLIYYLHSVGVDKFIARTLVLIITLLMSYIINCRMTFKSRIHISNFFAFIVGVGSLNFISYLISIVLMSNFFSLNPIIALNAGAGIMYLFNFIFQNKIFTKWRMQ